MDPGAVFASLQALGGSAPRTIIIGCQAESVDEGIGLTDVVGAAVPEAIAAIQSVLQMLASETCAAVREG
jgi:hydrogenase maturation protease